MIGTLLFSLFQFGCFCACCVYIVRRYIPVIKKQQEDEALRYQNSVDRRNEMQNIVDVSGKDFQEHTARCKILYDKVLIWKSGFEQRQQEDEIIKTRYSKQAEERFIKQRNIRELQCIQQSIFPDVMERVHMHAHDLFFKDGHCSSKGTQYNDACIQRLIKDKEIF